MQTFRLIVFLISAVALPCAVFALMRANIKTIGKVILLFAIAAAARYLLGAVWTPEEMWLLWVKAFVAAVAFWFVWDILCATSLRSARPWVLFLAGMALPLIARFAFFGSPFAILGSPDVDLTSIALWGFTTAWALLYVVLFARKVTKFGRIVLFCVGVALLEFFVIVDVETDVRSYAGNLGDYLRKNVVERWEPIKHSTEKIVSAWNALVDQDRRATANGKIGAKKIVASRNIIGQVAKLRRDLLTVDSRAVLERVWKLDGKIASAKKKLSSLRERRGLDPAHAEKLDAKISEAESEFSALESARADAISTARRELKEIGLDLPENSPFLTVDLGALIDNAIVAKNIGFVVENLKSLVDAEKGDAEAAKRYYGAYIVMLDVQSECFRQYLDKAAAGIWRDGITDVAKNAEAAKKGNEAKAAAEGRSEEEKKAFLHAAGTNEKTLKAAQAYLAILRRHEEIIREKLAATEKRHEIALSFWESVDIASAFGAKAISDMADFEALLELKLPEIAFFDDVAMKAEFDAITQKLMKE